MRHAGDDCLEAYIRGKHLALVVASFEESRIIRTGSSVSSQTQVYSYAIQPARGAGAAGLGCAFLSLNSFGILAVLSFSERIRRIVHIFSSESSLCFSEVADKKNAPGTRT